MGRRADYQTNSSLLTSARLLRDTHLEAARARSRPQLQAARRGYEFYFCTTGFDRVPIPEMLMLTVSPLTIGPTPAGVPVRIRSPGSSVITAEIHSTIAPTSWIISEVRLSCLTSPLTSVRNARSSGSRSVTIHGPIGQNVSCPFARVH